jgi:hypothetical protein
MVPAGLDLMLTARAEAVTYGEDYDGLFVLKKYKERTMKLRSFLFICLAIAAFAKGRPLSNLPITTTLLSTDLSGTNTDIQSDGLGSYFDGVDADTSFLTTNGYNGIVWGDWQFGTLNSTIRRVSLSFGNPIQLGAGGTATPNAPFTTRMVVAHIEDLCTMISNNMIKMTAGQTLTCPAIVHFFNTNGDEFRIYMAPNWTQPPTPETTFVQVTCNSVASDGCNDWYVDPIPSIDGSGNPIPGTAVGRLVGPPVYGRGKSATDGNQGDYSFRFHFHLTRP